MFQWRSYLESICEKYAEWWTTYTITDVLDNKQPPLLLDLQVKKIAKDKRSQTQTEILNILDGLRLYAPNHVLLSGRPGLGKSTALQRLLLELAKEALKDDRAKIPVLVELRYINTSVLERIRSFISQCDPNLNLDLLTIEKLLNQDKFLVLLDGLNEISSQKGRLEVMKFRQDYPNTAMVFTTRDISLGGDLNIENKLEMQPLTKKQMREFVLAYLPREGESMLKQLDSRSQELAETPLLLWMLISVFANDYSKQLPSNLGLVFREFTRIYNNKIKQNVPTYKESDRWWDSLLQNLAWEMTQGDSEKESKIAITKQQAETILTEYLTEKVQYPLECAKMWLNDLLKYHLIEIGADNKIQFRHQQIQEYYTAENLLKRLDSIGDRELKQNYLNYLKWTEPTALMLALLENKQQAIRVVKLAFEVDWQLGARLAGEVDYKWHSETLKLIEGLQLPRLVKIYLFGETKSERAIDYLKPALNDPQFYIRYNAAKSLVNIGSKRAIELLIPALKDSDPRLCEYAALFLGKINSNPVIDALISALKSPSASVCNYAARSLVNIGSKRAIDALISASKDPNASVRSYVAKSLGNINNNDAVITALIYALNERDSSVCYYAARSLANISSKRAIDALINASKDSKCSGSDYSKFFLKEIDDNAVITPTLADVQKGNPNLKDFIAEYDPNEINENDVIERLITFFQDSGFYNVHIKIEKNIKNNADLDWESDVSNSATESQKNIDSDKVTERLILDLKHSDFRVRYSSRQSLEKIYKDTAINSLMTILKNADFVTANEGDTFTNAIASLKAIQNKLGYYRSAQNLIMSKTLSQNYALLIGVGDCKYSNWSLPVTVKDIQALKSILTEPNLCGYIDNENYIRSLQDKTATKESIIDNLNWLKEKANNDRESTILIYYSGHGCLNEASNKYYLIPHDTDPLDIENTAIEAEQFNRILQEIKAKKILVIIDSCHAGGMASSKEAKIKLPDRFRSTPFPKNLTKKITRGQGKVVFTSSTGQQSSWILPDETRSIFTQHFIEALQGAGNQPGDEYVKVSNIMSYIGQTVPESVRQYYQVDQTPFFDFATEDFPVAQLCGGKGLPKEGWEAVKEKAEQRFNTTVENNYGQITPGATFNEKVTFKQYFGSKENKNS